MNVTQLTSNYLGGVSRKPDFDKEPGEVNEATNVIPDETYGLVKRTGTEWKGQLHDGVVPNSNWADWNFFPLIREGRSPYLLGIHGNATYTHIKIWNLNTGVEATIEDPNGASDYFIQDTNSGIDRGEMFRIASDDQRTVIVNRSKRVDYLRDGTDGRIWEDGLPDNSVKKFFFANDTKYTEITGGTTTKFKYGDRYATANSISDLPDGSVKEVRLIQDGDEGNRGPLRDGWHILGTRIDINDNADSQDSQAGGCTIKAYIKQGLIWEGHNSGHNRISLYSGGFGYIDKQTLYVDNVSDLNYNGTGNGNENDVTPAEIRINTGLLPGMVYRVKNSSSSEDDFYMCPLSTEYDATSGQSSSDFTVTYAGTKNTAGPWYYVEVPSPKARVGLDNDTLPVELYQKQDEFGQYIDTFVLDKIDYSLRWAGDDINNPDPSFVGYRIENAFFSNNRLGFLSRDNVILSRPINYGPDGVSSDVIVPDSNPLVRRNYKEIDFFCQSGMHGTPDDPIDLNAASNDTSVYHNAVSTPQGILLFSDGAQSLLYSDSGYLTPQTAAIRTLSAYAKSPDTDALLLGTEIYFLNKTDKFCRLNRFVSRGQQEPPLFEDITASVSDWLPNDLSDLTGNNTVQFLAAYTKYKYDIYINKIFEESSSWTKWTVPAKLLHLITDHDRIFFVMNDDSDNLIYSEGNLFSNPDDRFTSGSTPWRGDLSAGDIQPYLDLYANNVTATVSNGISTLSAPTGYPYFSNGDVVAVIGGAENQDGVGLVIPCYWDSGTTLKSSTDLSPYSGRITIGYRFTTDVVLPTFYYQRADGGMAPDYTANLTISRVKIALGMSGDATFNVRSQVNGSHTSAWTALYSQPVSNVFALDRLPITESQVVHEIPVHQRNDRFEIRITSDTPFPLSIDSSMWEGNYNPRYFRRQ